MNKEILAKWLHDNYEEIAKGENWNTQDNCKVEFNDLPKENRAVMIKTAERLLDFDLLRLHFVSKRTPANKTDHSQIHKASPWG